MKLLSLIFLLWVFHQSNFAQSNKFVASIFINANGIEMQGETNKFWQNVDGTVWGGLGSSLGVNVKKNILKNRFLKFEIRYIQKGSVYDYVNEYASRSVDLFKVNYIEIPLTFGIAFPHNKKVKSLEAGLSLARMFSSRSQITKLSGRSYQANAENFNDFDTSLIALMQFPAFTKHTNHLSVGIRCAYSLSSMHEFYTLRHLVYGVQLDYSFG
jgi:hypothetical protein